MTNVGYESPISQRLHVDKPPRRLNKNEPDIIRFTGTIAGLHKGMLT